MNTIKKIKKDVTDESREKLLSTLKTRFESYMQRHEGLEWSDVQDRLEANPEKIWSLNKMEETGGEPDVVGYDKETKEFIFFDCSAETPDGRRNVCYDHEALEARKKYPPEDSALNMAEMIGIELLTEEEYFYLQKLGEFDTKTSSWLKTPLEVRKHGGAIFGDRRFGRVFVYHNGADSYYGARGFRGSIRV
jgi:hypothetical protein